MLILASASPRRRELLGSLDVPFEVDPAEADETLPDGMEPREAAALLARRKAHEVALRRPEDWVLGADTIVVLGQEIMGKPADEADAVRMLRALSGREHLVITGVCLLNRDRGIERCDAVETKVRFRELSEAEITGYVQTGEPMDKAGAYAIQGGAAGFVEAVEGSYSNVVGLPLERVGELLREEGLRGD